MRKKANNIKVICERRRHEDIEYHINISKKQITCIIFTKNYVSKIEDLFQKEVLSRFNPKHLNIHINTDKLYNQIDVRNYIKPNISSDNYVDNKKNNKVFDCRKNKKMHLQPKVKYDNIFTYRATISYADDLSADDAFIQYKEDVYNKARDKEHSMLLQMYFNLIEELSTALNLSIQSREQLKQKFTTNG